MVILVIIILVVVVVISIISSSSGSGSSINIGDIKDASDIMIDTPCAAHAAQNSFKWALWKDEYTAEELKDAHILVEALRRSSNLFFGAVGDWVTKRMAFKPDLETDDIDASRLLWDALGVDPEVAETLSQLLQLKYNFETEQLEVAESAREMPGLVNNIVNTLMAIWEFKTSPRPASSQLVQVVACRWLAS